MRTNPTHTIPSLSGTFGIPARLAHNPKMPKEPSSPSLANARTEWCNKYGDDERINKGQLVTRGIKHWGLSGYSNFLPRIKFGVTGQEISPQSPTISYRHRCGQCFEDDSPI